ncbi:hypothetical protein MPNT_360009 [Candidatus Methylacidithermus pantelleriae]|uniref:Uncharacterized protein n=1 Tax=Candidatus Methylacidithermus pantelleriae TaxID=2744239 RepID=A0A8J2BPW5_9BACT|nr:hypothetical protein MPNT_360009 [Candidatus Methylacidithermus pantelleriae]
MPCKRKTHQAERNSVRDFRHSKVKRKNNPPPGVAPTYEAPKHQTRTYAYDPD